jgi:hypothetical protein
MTAKEQPPPRPRWVKVSIVVTLVVIAAIVVIALLGGEHGPGQHLPDGGLGDTKPVEQSL